MHNTISRRQFLAATGAITGTALLNPLTGMEVGAANIMAPKASKKLRLAMVGTGIRGTTMWGRDLMKAYPNYIEFVGLCDKNEGRVETGKRMIGTSCPTYTDFEKMMRETKPDVLIVTTMDCTHHEFIIRAMELWMRRKRLAASAASRSTTAIRLIVPKFGNCSGQARLARLRRSISIGIWTHRMVPTISAGGIGWWKTAVRFGCTRRVIILIC